MKKIILFLFVLLVTQPTKAQQATLNCISNGYLETPNLLSTLTAVNSLRNSIHNSEFGTNFPIQEDELSNSSFFYKIYYKKNSSSMKEGILNIQCTSADLRASDFDKAFKQAFNLYVIDDDLEDYTKKVIKTTDLDAGYFFSKKNNTIYLLVYSKSKPGFLRATINTNLNIAEKIDLAEDFIRNTSFN